jgi:hypothetical protein
MEQHRHQSRHALQSREQAPHLVPRQHDRQPLTPFGLAIRPIATSWCSTFL